MGRQHIRNGVLTVRQVKTGAELPIPVHPELDGIRADMSGMTFLTTQFGKPFTAAGFGNWFREQCNDAGLAHCSAHGLCKAAARRLAEAECTEHEIAAITGHATLREIARYTKAADQQRLARAAMEKVSAKGEQKLVRPDARFDNAGKKPSEIKVSFSDWLPFLDTYRTMCMAPDPHFQRLLEEVGRTQPVG
jgi:hypothetical protein